MAEMDDDLFLETVKQKLTTITTLVDVSLATNDYLLALALKRQLMELMGTTADRECTHEILTAQTHIMSLDVKISNGLKHFLF